MAKGRESGMPQKEIWETFLDPGKILETLGLNGNVKDVAEFGCGYGTFTIPAAGLVKGKVYAIDIDVEMIKITQQEARKNGLENVKVMTRDFLAEGTGLKTESVDYVMLFNILHIENPDELLQEAYRILKSKGKLGIIHWNYDPKTPRGPSMDIRPKPERCIEWAGKAGFVDPERFNLEPYHYGIVMSKKGKGK